MRYTNKTGMNAQVRTVAIFIDPRQDASPLPSLDFLERRGTLFRLSEYQGTWRRPSAEESKLNPI
jgi:hypothetical protein